MDCDAKPDATTNVATAFDAMTLELAKSLLVVLNLVDDADIEEVAKIGDAICSICPTSAVTTEVAVIDADVCIVLSTDAVIREVATIALCIPITESPLDEKGADEYGAELKIIC